MYSSKIGKLETINEQEEDDDDEDDGHAFKLFLPYFIFIYIIYVE